MSRTKGRTGLHIVVIRSPNGGVLTYDAAWNLAKRGEGKRTLLSVRKKNASGRAWSAAYLVNDSKPWSQQK